jgi:dephospho-CoA kinase
MIVIGLTGSIGMGKSTTAGFFRAAGVRVHDADATVHALYRGAAVAPIEAAFPGTTADGTVDRARLSALVLGDPAAVARLERIVHPLVRAAEADFRAAAFDAGAAIVVLDVPLLFETGGDARVDLAVTVTASAEIQRARVLARPGMSEATFDRILARQMPDAEKRRRAHAIVDTSFGIEPARRQVDGLLRAFRGMSRIGW